MMALNVPECVQFAPNPLLTEIPNILERLVTQKHQEQLFIIPKKNHAKCRNAFYTSQHTTHHSASISVLRVSVIKHFASVA